MCGLQTNGNNNDMPHSCITKHCLENLFALQLKFIMKQCTMLISTPYYVCNFFHVTGNIITILIIIIIIFLLLLLGVYISVLQRRLLPPSSRQQSKHVSSILKMEVRPELYESYAKRL